jgi:segregation and condensation protein B
MSLKSKIEAVIYASEEPVTLAQLMGLLGQEAQAELDQIDASQQSLDLDGDGALGEVEASDAETLNAEIIGEAEPAAPSELDADPEPSQPAEPAAGEVAVATDGDGAKTAREAKEEKEKNRRLRDYFRSLLDQLIADYANGDRGLEVREVAGGYRLATKPEYHDAVRGFVKSLKPPLKLSLQALETLAVVAYKQPITAPEVSEIRGVDSGGVLGSLMTRKLVTTAGRKQVIGRPILYKTTKDFLLRFGLKDINELPSIEEFEKMAGELTEQEEIQMDHISVSEETPSEREAVSSEVAESLSGHHAPETADELESQRHTHLPQADGSPDPVDDPLDDQLPDDGIEEAPVAGSAPQHAEPVEAALEHEEASEEPVESKQG